MFSFTFCKLYFVILHSGIIARRKVLAMVRNEVCGISQAAGVNFNWKIQTPCQRHWHFKAKSQLMLHLWWSWEALLLLLGSCCRMSACKHLAVWAWDFGCLVLKIRAAIRAWFTNNCTVHNNSPLQHINPVKISNNTHRIWARNMTDYIFIGNRSNMCNCSAAASLWYRGLGLRVCWGSGTGPGEVGLSWGASGTSRNKLPSSGTTANS